MRLEKPATSRDMLRGYCREGGQDIARGMLSILIPHPSKKVLPAQPATLRNTLKMPFEWGGVMVENREYREIESSRFGSEFDTKRG